MSGVRRPADFHTVQVVPRNGSIAPHFEMQKLRRGRRKSALPEFPLPPARVIWLIAIGSDDRGSAAGIPISGRISPEWACLALIDRLHCCCDDQHASPMLATPSAS